MTRVSLTYPKIRGSADAPLANCIAFEKYDGTNVHWAWNEELGWFAFGMRRHQYDLDENGVEEFHQQHPGLPDVTEVFHRTLAEPLAEVIRSAELPGESITVFTEYFGARSFAGKHVEGDAKQLVLFDVETADGFVPPAEFIARFSELPIARVVYQGKLTGKFAEDVRQGRYDVDEGVVCKGGDTPDSIWMAKIKTNAYRVRLKEAFADAWEDHWE